MVKKGLQILVVIELDCKSKPAGSLVSSITPSIKNFYNYLEFKGTIMNSDQRRASLHDETLAAPGTILLKDVVVNTKISSLDRNFTDRVGEADYVGYVVDGFGFAAESTSKIEYTYGQNINGIINSSTRITAENAVIFGKIAAKLNFAGGVIGIYDSGAQVLDDFDKGDYLLGLYEVSKGIAYTVGTGMLLTPLAPIGGSILLITGGIDMAGDLGLYLYGRKK